MMGTRRGFLGALAGAASAMVLDPERLLWRPGAKLISIPAVGPYDPRAEFRRMLFMHASLNPDTNQLARGPFQIDSGAWLMREYPGFFPRIEPRIGDTLWLDSRVVFPNSKALNFIEASRYFTRIA